MKTASSRKPELASTPWPSAGTPRFDRFGRGSRQQVAHEQRRQRRAGELRDPVDDRQWGLDPARDQEPERDRRVEVPARDVAQGADHHADREPVGDRDTDQRGVVDASGGRRRAGPDERQRERADRLGDRTAQRIFGHAQKL